MSEDVPEPRSRDISANDYLIVANGPSELSLDDGLTRKKTSHCLTSDSAISISSPQIAWDGRSDHTAQCAKCIETEGGLFESTYG